MSDLISDYIKNYRRQHDFYREAARVCAQHCELMLENEAIRAIVTHRAKRPDRLEDKLKKRAEKKGYASIADIDADIVDLAGVRIAIYFPGDLGKVERLLREAFVLAEEPKLFPDGSPSRYDKQFPGYKARHYRVTLRKDSMEEKKHDYCEARIEIQVASVLMHAWSEVEHDMVYKPLSGEMSEDELAILDELNGLVLTGEIALQRLQRAFESRVARRNSPFSNHFELAASLLEAARVHAPKADPLLGRVDILHRFLQRLGLDSMSGVSPYFPSLDFGSADQPIHAQLIDLILAERPDDVAVYRKVQEEFQDRDPFEGVLARPTKRRMGDVGNVLAGWMTLEGIIADMASRLGLPGRPRPGLTERFLVEKGVLSATEAERIREIQKVRTLLAHSRAGTVSDRELEGTLADIRDLLDELPRRPLGPSDAAKNPADRPEGDVPFDEGFLRAAARAERPMKFFIDRLEELKKSGKKAEFSISGKPVEIRGLSKISAIVRFVYGGEMKMVDVNSITVSISP